MQLVSDGSIINNDNNINTFSFFISACLLVITILFGDDNTACKTLSLEALVGASKYQVYKLVLIEARSNSHFVKVCHTYFYNHVVVGKVTETCCDVVRSNLDVSIVNLARFVGDRAA